MSCMRMSVFKFQSSSKWTVKILFALLDSYLSNLMDCWNFLVPNAKWMVDADQLWTIPADDRITVDLTPGVQTSTESAEGGRHRICPNSPIRDISRLRQVTSSPLFSPSFSSQWDFLFNNTVLTSYRHMHSSSSTWLLLTALTFRFLFSFGSRRQSATSISCNCWGA